MNCNYREIIQQLLEENDSFSKQDFLDLYRFETGGSLPIGEEVIQILYKSKIFRSLKSLKLSYAYLSQLNTKCLNILI